MSFRCLSQSFLCLSLHFHSDLSASVVPAVRSTDGRGHSSRRRDCHLADSPSPSPLKHLLKAEGGAAKRRSRRRLQVTRESTAHMPIGRELVGCALTPNGTASPFEPGGCTAFRIHSNSQHADPPGSKGGCPLSRVVALRSVAIPIPTRWPTWHGRRWSSPAGSRLTRRPQQVTIRLSCAFVAGPSFPSCLRKHRPTRVWTLDTADAITSTHRLSLPFTAQSPSNRRLSSSNHRLPLPNRRPITAFHRPITAFRCLSLPFTAL